MDCNDCNSSIISRSMLQLTHFVDSSAIRWPNITLSSHQHIVILESRRLRIIDCVQKCVLLSVHCDAHSARMNPQMTKENSSSTASHDVSDVRLLAVRDSNVIKVVNLQNVQHALASQSHTREDDFPAILNDADMVVEHVQQDPILFWRWLDAEIIAIITARHVYHWMPTMAHSTAKCILTLHSDDDSDRRDSSSSSFVQYINYDQSKDGNYLFVQGLTQSKKPSLQHAEERENRSSHKSMNGVDGVVTLYDIESGVVRHRMNAFGACFASLSSFENITLFCYTKKEYVDSDDSGGESVTKLYIVELSKKNENDTAMTMMDDEDAKWDHLASGHHYHVRVEREVQFYHTNDFVVSMVQCRTVLYAVTKLGCLLIFDISSGQCLYNQKVSRDVIFLVAPYPRENGIVALDRTGKLTLYYLNKSEFNDIPIALRKQQVSIVNFNAYNNSFSLKHKNTFYESSLYLHAPHAPPDAHDRATKSVLCVGHIKLVLSKALGVQHIGFITIAGYSGSHSDDDEGTAIVTPLGNDCRLSEELRLLKIDIHPQCVDATFDAVVRYYHGHYGVSVGVVEDILSENLFDYNCDELKLYTMNFLMTRNQKITDNVTRLEKQLTLMHGERLNTLSNDELLEMEKTVNASYLKIRQFIRGKLNCIVCYEKEKHVLFKPCHHYVVCMRCSEKLEKCPVCNSRITDKIKVFQ